MIYYINRLKLTKFYSFLMILILVLYGNNPHKCCGHPLYRTMVNIYDNDLQDIKLIHLKMPEGLKLPNANPEYDIPVIKEATFKYDKLDFYPPIQLLTLIKGDYILHDAACKIVFSKNDNALFKKIETIFLKRKFSIKQKDNNKQQLITKPINWQIWDNILSNNQYQIKVGNENNRTTLTIKLLAANEHINPINRQNSLLMMTNELTIELIKFNQSVDN